MPGVIVDYGHGGIMCGEYMTPGRKQYKFTYPKPLTILEGETNRRIAAEFIALALEHGVKVWDCVANRKWKHAPRWTELEQADIKLRKRVHHCNSVPGALVLSIHSNAIGDNISGPSIPVRGVSFFTSPGGTKSDTIATSLMQAAREAYDVNACKLRPRKVVEAKFTMLTRTIQPAVLAECGFFTNYNDAVYLTSHEGQREIARMLLAGLLPYT